MKARHCTLAEHFRPRASLAKNVFGFCFLKGPFYGYSERLDLYGRSLFGQGSDMILRRHRCGQPAPVCPDSSTASTPMGSGSTPRLLGHTSIRTTEKHYAPWVESMQQRLDAATAKLDFIGGKKFRRVG